MAECSNGDVVYIGDVGEVVGFFKQGIDGILTDIAVAIMGAAVDLFADLGNIPTLATNADGEKINGQIHLQTDWLVVTIAVASLLAASFRMALDRRGQPGTEALKGLVRMVLVASFSWYVVKLLSQEADAYSSHLYDQGIKAQLKLLASCSGGTDGFTAFLLIIVGLLLLLAGIVHVILMYIRLGAMTLLTGTLPMAAAASMTQWGGGWWRKHIAWMVAWLAFKPVCGLIMYSGAVMIGATGGSAKHFRIAGAGILLLTAVALPGLMRLVVPAMAALGSGDGMGATVGAAGAGAGAVASGAKTIAGGAKWAGSKAGGAKAKAPTGGPAAAGGGAAAAGGGAAAAGGGAAAAAGGPRRSTVRRAVGGAARTLQYGAGAVAITAHTAQKTVSKVGGVHKHASEIGRSAIPDDH